MMKTAYLNIFSIFLLYIILTGHSCYGDNKAIDDFLKQYNTEADQLQREDTLASWDYETDMSKGNKDKTTEMSGKTSKFALDSRKKAEELLKDIGDDTPAASIRQLKLITRTASSSSSDESKEVSELISKMTAIYSKTSIVKTIDDKKYKFKLNSHLLPIMSEVSSENLGNLRWAWRVWRKAVGPKIKPLYEKFVTLVNKGAKENGFDDYGDYWRKEYEVDNLESIIEETLKEMHELYKKLHAFVRFKLNNLLGDDVVSKTGPMPAHLLSMWGQNWGHLYNLLNPFPKKHIPDVTKEMKNKGWTTKKLLQQAESFFVSLGLDKMPKSFYENSLLKKENGRKSVCHPSSWDLGQGDVRLKMPCMGVSQADMITVHHEMGHIEYYLMYQNQPVEFRTGANPGFHEAVGDTIALSVMIPEHLESIDLLDKSVGDDEEGINFLLKQALQKVAFLPFAYIVDKFRWSVFNGIVHPTDFNTYWWELKVKFQGMKEPMNRTDDDLFDAGTFFHVAHNTEYLRYFISHVLQFQFHEALCDEADHKGPYHKCSIHNSKKAGRKLRNMLELGKELPWPDALDVLAGTKKMSSKPILDYFKPLENWLDKHREENNYPIGWDEQPF
ncbi:angiotensin-converting enzyme-like [Hydractinia symbiolongicarpus]|uniref:angiotensin-converting enzyme-like n=1 Tax=Hydractinia symbiolongicarpus TaxID=13093 RepID=UPI00254D847E|nr:angiotensin-converting enzyme-like [Hydractinia symbiolongicarpus]